MSEAHSTTNISYWVDSTAAPEHPSLEGTVDVEVAIVGAGIVGLTAARLLKRSGKTVAVIEMDRMVRGVTGYTTAKITSGHSLIYQQLENYLLVPRVMRNTVDISSLAVLLSALVGATVMGVMGALMAIPLAAAVKVVLTPMIESRTGGAPPATSQPEPATS